MRYADDDMGLTDKQYEGSIKEQIASFDRIAEIALKMNDLDVLKAIYKERKLAVSKLGYDIDENNLYDQIK